MNQNHLCPPGHRWIVRGGKKVPVPVETSNVVAFVQGSGRLTGEVASILVTPLEMVRDMGTAVGRSVRDSEFGQGAQHGWHNGQRRKVVLKTASQLRSGDVQELQRRLVNLGEDPNRVLGLTKSQLAREIAEYETEDSYICQETFQAPTAEVIGPQSAAERKLDKLITLITSAATQEMGIDAEEIEAAPVAVT